MIAIKCKNCGASGGKKLVDVSKEVDTYLDYIKIDYSNVKREYVKCDNCGLIYRTIILENDEKELLYRHYRDENFRNETREEYFERITSLPLKDSENFEKCQFLKQYIANDNVHQKVLDVGCGAGVFLYSFQKVFNNWDTLGVEPTKDFSDVAKSKGINIVNEYLDENTFNETFDLITLNHVLEHLDNYFDMLKMLKKYMSKTSLLYIEVPSSKDIGYLDNSHDRFMCHHEVIFSELVLNNMAKGAGYEVVVNEVFFSKRKRNNVRLLLRSIE